jgi:hypothetical protein
VKRIIRGSYLTLWQKTPALTAFANKADGAEIASSLSVEIANAICHQYDVHRDAFDIALAHPRPVEAIRTAARSAGIPLVSFLYGVPEIIAEAVEPATVGSIVTGVVLNGMEPHVLAELSSLGKPITEAPSYVLSTAGDGYSPLHVYEWVSKRLLPSEYAYELLRAGVPAATLPKVNSHNLMTAIIRGVPAVYAASFLAAGMSVDETLTNYEAGITLEYALALKETF